MKKKQTIEQLRDFLDSQDEGTQNINECGCKGLITAFLVRAVRDLTIKGSEYAIKHVDVPKKGAEYRADAIDFILSNSLEPFSFLWCCEHIDLNGFALRNRLSSDGFLSFDNVQQLDLTDRMILEYGFPLLGDWCLNIH